VLLVSHDRALLDAVAHRLLAFEDGRLVSSDGGWADYVSGRDERQAPAPEPKPVRAAKPARPRKPQPSPIELIEAEIARSEAKVAELEGKLAEDWGDTKLAAAHTAAREELQTLLERWELLFEQSGV
jgi:ATPase subunit of ABC transporter with duplicated ATPase domains